MFYYNHCGDIYDGGVSVLEGIIRPCFITHCGDTYDGGVLVPEGIISPSFITITVEILVMAVYQSSRVLSAHVL
jgi:hypothetical protein